MDRDPHDYTLEVCKVCGAQLDRYENGRCPVSRAHWRFGGVIEVVRADAYQGAVAENARLQRALEGGSSDQSE